MQHPGLTIRPFHTLLAGVVAFLIPWAFGPAEDFIYDAAQYWGGAAALVAGDDAVTAGGLATRGVFTAVIYLVPAVVTAALGPESAVWTVLVWNAALGAVVLVVLVPRLAGLLLPSTSGRQEIFRVWTAAVLGGLMIGGFARYPLVDVWSTCLALTGLLMLATCRKWWALSLAGFACVVAANLRPSLIAPLAIAVLVLLWSRPKVIAVALPAAVLALAPQVLLNLKAWNLWSIVPRETVPLSAVQAAQAPFALRYDTVAFADQAPQQWYCDPAYAALLVEDETPTNQVGVIASAASHLPDSLWFLFRKAAANLQWSLATPYGDPPGEGFTLLGALVVAVASFGIVVIVFLAFGAEADCRRRVTLFAMVGFWFGALGTLVFSTPETRFALPLVLVGLVGVTAGIAGRDRLRSSWRRVALALVVGLALSIALTLAGVEALTHAMPPGPLSSAAACVAR